MHRYVAQNYLTPERWLAFQRQVELVSKTKAQRVLEVGKGSGIVAFALASQGISVKTFDIDPSLSPDFSGDIRSITSIVPPSSFDCVIAAQILEHISWSDVPQALAELASVSRQWCVVSVPYCGITVLPSLRWGRHRFHDWQVGMRIPAFWRTRAYFKKGDHRWEIGARPFSRRAFRTLLQAQFRVVTETWHPSHHHMLFYLCEKLDTCIRPPTRP
ncbi:MAG: class I SAM-dependent methyltransferase [Kiritimatiellae bacterium]|nr:class I SAM-dependent methyltransferase [Kiritimatiellia bacterium]